MKALFVLLMMVAFKANSAWVCSGAALPIRDITAIYSGERVLSGGKWVTAYMLPSKHPLSIEMFGQLGISPVAVEKRAMPNSLIDTGIRLKTSLEAVISEMPMNAPSLGYSDGFKLGAINDCN